jgi:hypothetical protein
MSKSRFLNLMKNIFPSKAETVKFETLKDDINAIARLIKVEKDIQASSFPLKNTTLRTIESLKKAYISPQPASSKDIHNAVFIDSAQEGYPIIKTFLNRGATYTQEDVTLIKNIDEPAAEFLSKKLLNR